MTQSTLINLHPNECSQAYTTIQFHLIWIDVWEVVIHLKRYLIMYVLETK